MVRFALLAAALGLLSCTQNPPQEAQPALGEVLRLEMRVGPEPKRAMAPFDVHLALRNVGAAPLTFCQLDSGVSIGLLRFGDREPQPVVLHGLAAINPGDACNERTTLMPGAAKEFRETVRLRRDLTGWIHLVAQIRVHPTAPLPRGAEVPRIRAPSVAIVIQPAAPAG